MCPGTAHTAQALLLFSLLPLTKKQYEKHIQQPARAVFCAAAPWGFAARYGQPHWHMRVQDWV